MNRSMGALFAFALVFAVANSAEAQVYQAYYPAPVTAYYAPAPVYSAPVPVYSAPAAVYYPPTVVATTRYRPLIGGTVTRWRYVNPPTPVSYYRAW